MQGRRASIASFPGPIRAEFYLQRSKEFIDPCSVPRCDAGSLAGERGVCAPKSVCVEEDYKCEIGLDDFDSQKTKTARPSSPVPSNSRDEGSGVTVKWPWKSMPDEAPLV